MKKYLVILLVLALLIPGAVGIVGSASEGVTVKPFQVLNYWGGSGNDYVYKLPTVTASMEKVGADWVATLTYNGKTGKEAAAAVKKDLDANPAGARYVRFDIQDALAAAAENVVYTDKSVPPLKKAFGEFFAEYKALGGVLDGVYTNQKLATYYGNTSPSYWYLHSNHYSGGTNNKSIYWEIVQNPLYESKLRPMLEDRGFIFYPVDPAEPEKSEIFYIYPYTDKRYDAKYQVCFRIWDIVMQVMVTENVTEAVYVPLMEQFPDAIMADGYSRDTAGWTKEVSIEAGALYQGGNLIKAGNASCYHTDEKILLDGKTFPGFNGSSFTMTPFTQLLWDVNQFKGIYRSTDTGNVVAWIGDCYNSNQGFTGQPGYYSEMLYHLAMANVDTFFGYFYNDRKQQQMASQIMAELTRILGASDRKPIDLPISWNSDYIISGMYAGGKNYWRITPNVDKVAFTAFRVAGDTPTFHVNGQTISFPEGTVLKGSDVIAIGSNGYWVETPVDVYPVMTGEAGRYEKSPSFTETFDALNADIWHQHTGFPVASVSGGKLNLAGKTELRNLNTVGKVKAGDSFAKQQAWEVTVTVPANLNPKAKITLMSYCDADGGFVIENGKLWYDKKGKAVQFPGVDLSNGGTFTLKREMDMTITGAFTSSYYVYDAEGVAIGQVQDVPAVSATLPLTYLLYSSTEETNKAVSLDNVKYYPIGFTAEFETYKAANGIREDTVSPLRAYDLGYRLSYLNVTDQVRKISVVAVHYDGKGSLVSRETLQELTVQPGTDGIVTGIAQKKYAFVQVSLVEQDAPNTVTLLGVGNDTQGAGKYFPGSKVTIDAGVRPGFTFAGWQTGNLTLSDPASPVATFTMPEGNVTLTATWILSVEDGIRPFTMTNWGGVEEGKFSNVLAMPQFMFDEVTGEITWNGISDLDQLAVELKSYMDARPEGTRWINFGFVGRLLRFYHNDVIYLDTGVRIMHDWLDEFLATYKAIGGKLDGLAQDMEWFDAESWFLRSNHYLKGEKDIYKRIVEDPLYEIRLRPYLAERGFQFYPANDDPNKSEIFSACYEAGSAYSVCWKIWDAVSRNLMSTYMNECVTEPLVKYYPYAQTNDYTTRDVYGWTKQVDVDGSALYLGGNWNKTGHSSNFNTYSYTPDMISVSGGVANYKKPISYNNAIYGENPYNMSLWDVNLFKYMYACTPEKKISVWFGNYNYSCELAGSNSCTPYYVETLLHAGLLDPDPFLGFICGNFRDNLTINDDYNYALQVASDILTELTRVVGAADRRPIELPINWNDGYLLSGMYAGGRNVWRITPDTGLIDLEDFLVDAEDPTFSVNGITVTFPGGKLIEDGHISEVGTCGYWIETATDVMPVITTSANRYRDFPAFGENFEGYEPGITFDNSTAKFLSVWKTSGTAMTVESDGNNQYLALMGTATLENQKVPQNVTAADTYARKQIWEVTVELPDGLSNYAQIKLLNVGANDGGFRISNGKLSYSQNGTYRQMSGVNMTAGKYTFQRLMDFDAGTCGFYVYDGNGKLLGKQENVKLASFKVPVETIGISCANVNKSVKVDDYKIYIIGSVVQYEIYDAYTGIICNNQTLARKADTAFRLSWLNATDTAKTGAVVAEFYNAQGTKVAEQVIRQVKMNPGADGVETGIVKLGAYASVRVYWSETYTGGLPCQVLVSGGTADVATATPGATVTLTANAAPAGQVFDRWFIETDSYQFFLMADPTKATTTFTMPDGLVSVRATYKDAPYTVTVTVDEEMGTVTGAGSYDVGDEARLQAIAKPGYKFVGWQENGQIISKANPMDLPLTGDRNLTAVFAPVASDDPNIDPTDPTGPTEPGSEPTEPGTTPTEPGQSGGEQGSGSALPIILAVIAVVIVGAIIVVIVLKKKKS